MTKKKIKIMYYCYERGEVIPMMASLHKEVTCVEQF